MKKLFPLGYLLSIVFIMIGIFYFFASNWPGFDRIERVGLSIGLLLFIYFMSLISGKYLTNEPKFPRWLLVGAALSFGISVALIGQIYNSHADSYMLFAIWLLPTLCLALITTYTPFFLLSYALFLLTYWFYMNPSTVFIYRTELEEWGIYLGMVLINGVLFALTYIKGFQINTLRYVSYVVMHVFLIVSTGYKLFEPYSFWMNFVYLLFFVILFGWLLNKCSDRIISLLTFTMAGVFLLVKYFELGYRVTELIGELGFYLFSAVGGFLVLIGGIFLAIKISKQKTNENSTAVKVFKHSLIVIVTLTTSIIFTTSIGGFLYLVTQSAYSIVWLSTTFLVVGVLLKKLPLAARYTLLITGFFSSLAGAFFINEGITLFYAILSLVILVRVKERLLQFFSYTLFMLCTLVLLFVHLEFNENFRLILLGVSLSQFIVVSFGKGWVLTRSIKPFAFLYGYLCLYPTAFLGGTWQETIGFQVIYLVIASLYLLVYTKESNRLYGGISWLFLGLFFIGLYYDYAWKLLHKSLTFALVGMLLFVIVKVFDRDKLVSEAIFSKKKSLLIGLVACCQLLLLGVQTYTNEQHLKNGKEIVLELEPIDPRSVLQGDYVRLNYDISSIPEQKDIHKNGSRLTLLLKKNDEGIYQSTGKIFDGTVDVEKLNVADDEALITGKYDGYQQLNFGIENFFVEEGTGTKLEQNAKLATVKVSKKGDALLVDVE
ncbi:GDYXXLXY domain-containing protein [Metabacillus herbersteinensis]|uniref:GDYXXLXY domain-containing protein n=1 Tax=Metabacillus herbersteinensis TaxID=283816 RepID=A0ABV6GAQ8_9BACI